MKNLILKILLKTRKYLDKGIKKITYRNFEIISKKRYTELVNYKSKLSNKEKNKIRYN